MNTLRDGKEIHLIAVRENGEYVILRSMQHTSSVIYHELNYPEFDFHSLRHTHATMLAENEVPPKYQQQRLGHKNLEVTIKLYLHLTKKMQEKGSDILQRMYQAEEKRCVIPVIKSGLLPIADSLIFPLHRVIRTSLAALFFHLQFWIFLVVYVFPQEFYIEVSAVYTTC